MTTQSRQGDGSVSPYVYCETKAEEAMLQCAGYLPARPWTLEEVGEALGLTRERVRQIEKKALAQLKTSPRFRQFREVLFAHYAMEAA